MLYLDAAGRSSSAVVSLTTALLTAVRIAREEDPRPESNVQKQDPIDKDMKAVLLSSDFVQAASTALAAAAQVSASPVAAEDFLTLTAASAIFGGRWIPGCNDLC